MNLKKMKRPLMTIIGNPLYILKTKRKFKVKLTYIAHRKKRKKDVPAENFNIKIQKLIFLKNDKNSRRLEKLFFIILGFWGFGEIGRAHV